MPSAFGHRRAAAALMTMGLVSLSVRGALAARAEESAREATALLARQTDLLEKRVALASGDAFYLMLDPGAGKLLLMLKGAVLRNYPILGLEVGTPRVAFRPRHLQEEWQGRIWDTGNLSPARDREREEVPIPNADSTTTASSTDSASSTYHLPPTPEETYPVPHRYHIRYPGGLSLEVRPHDADQSAGMRSKVINAVRVWWLDCVAALQQSPQDQVRLRLMLKPEDAASLYRALPPDTRLLVLPAS